jgi:hypothetical protein
MSWRVAARRAGQAAAGLVVALGIAEGAFWLRDHGAFPHLNVYVPDARLGVRLRAGATERIAFGGNPVTRVRINADGYRGAELPPPRPDEILVVGDSQVFGLGVEEQETFAARLAALTGRPVVNGGVPTYGPDEYDAVVEEMLAKRHPSTVVYTINVANDLFEAGRPNRDRHVVWDGWAVRKQGTGAPSGWFPGRGLLFGQSHLVFALRKLAHGRDAGAVDAGLASEGTWTDLVGAGEGARKARATARAGFHDEVRKAEETRAAAEKDADALELKIDSAVAQTDVSIDSKELQEAELSNPNEWLRAARSASGDVVYADEGESSRAVPVTAKLIRQGGEYRRLLEAALKGPHDDGEHGAHAGDALELLGDWDKSAGALRALNAAPARVLRHASPLMPHVEKLKKACEAAGARLVVLVLPLDVMVSDAEWAKYGAKPQPMGGAAVLLDDLARASEESGVSALDASAALAAAEPGAFLAHDLHMTAKGHDAVARALAAKLAEPPPTFPTGALPEGRTRLPAPTAWERAAGVLTGAKAAGCSVSRSWEWWRINCYGYAHPNATPRGVTVVEGGQGDTMTFTTTNAMVLVARGTDQKLTVDFAWSDAVWRLDMGPKANGFTRQPAPPDGATGPSALEKKILACFKGNPPKARDLQLGADPDCARTYGDDCERLIECAQASPASPPDCPLGSVNAGGLGRCHPLCGPGKPCAHGRCQAWPGTHVCE